MRPASGFPRYSCDGGRARRLGLCLSTALLASACAVGPDFKQPAAPEATGYAPQPLPESTAAAEVTGGEAQRFEMGRDIPYAWWSEFGSPKLDALVERALENNPTITAAQAALRQSQEMVKAQQGFFFPTLGASYDFIRQKLSGNTANSSAPGVQGNGDVISPAIQSATSTPHNSALFYDFNTAQLSISYAPDVFGGNYRKVESLQAQAEAQRYHLEAAYISLADNVVAAAVQEAALRAQIEATQRFIDENAKALEILRKQFQLGYVMRIDVAQQESALAQARQQLPPLRKQLEQTHDLLRALAGVSPDQELELGFDFAGLRLPQDLPLSLPAQLVEQRPDVKAAAAQWHSASAEVGVAIANELPQLSITGNYGVNADHLRQLIYPGSGFWSFSGGVAQTVFDGGTLLHTRRAADQAMLQAAAQYRSTVLGALQNVADTLHAIQADADSLAASEAAERAAKVALEVTEKQHQLGYTDFLSLLVAREAWEQASITLVTAQGNRYADSAALYQALGGGWWHRGEAAR